MSITTWRPLEVNAEAFVNICVSLWARTSAAAKQWQLNSFKASHSLDSSFSSVEHTPSFIRLCNFAT